MAKRSDRKQTVKKEIEHPDDFVVDHKYSVLVEYGGKLRRVSGTFIALQSACDGNDFSKPYRRRLLIVLRRSIDTVMVPWCNSRAWVQIGE